jgi:hypothetical protein
MEMPQENSLYSYLKQTKMSFFFSLQTGEQKSGTDPGGGGSQWAGAWGCRERV